MPPPDDLDLLSPAELEGLVVQLWEQIIELRRLVAALRDENARRGSAKHQAEQQAEGYGAGDRFKAAGRLQRATAARQHASEADDQ